MGREAQASYRAVFADREFRKLFAAQGLSFVGDWLNNVALLVVAYELTGSAAAVGATLLAKTVPRVLFLLLGGAVADRGDRARLMVAMDLVRIPLALAPLLVGGRDGLWLLWGSTFLLQVGSSFFKPCVVPVVGTMFAARPHLLREANALLSLTVQLSIFVGPALGAAAMVLGGPPAAFWLNAASFAVSAVLLSSLRLPRSERAAGATGLMRSIPEGSREVFALAPLRLLTIGVGAGAAVIYLAQAHLPRLAAELGHGDGAVGLLIGAVGVGAFAGSRLSVILPTRLGATPGTALVLASMWSVSAAFAAGSLPLALVLLALNGLGTMWLELAAEREIQALRTEVQGRATSVYSALMAAGQLCGALAAIAFDRLDPVPAQLLLALPLGAIVLAVGLRRPAARAARPDPRPHALALAQDALGEGLLVVRGGRLVDWNGAAKAMTGHDDPSLRVLAHVLDLVVPQMRERWAAELAAAHATGRGRASRFMLRRRDGTTFEADCALSPVADGAADDALVVVRDVSASVAAERDLLHHAVHDGLTGLPNRALLLDRIAHALTAARRDSSTVALLLMDLDGFKEVNDSYGHHVGDGLLRHVARRIVGVLREVDTVGRLGGDEFGVVLPGADQDGALLVAEKIHAAFSPLFVVEARPIRVAASVGIAIGPDHGDDAATLLRRADLAMYDAKRARQGTRTFAAPLETRQEERRSLVDDLHAAFEDRELFLQYQPVIDLATERATCVEALVRWRHPRRGVLGPAEFLSVAEESGFGARIDEFTLRTALARCRAWRMAGFRELAVAVNFGMDMLHQPDVVSRVDAAVRDAGVPPESLVVEVTEGTAMTEPERVIGCLRELRERGIGVSIDDFGTGYASLSYLQRMPASVLKLDRSFVIGAEPSASPQAFIVRSAISLGHELGMTVVAEGVEDDAAAGRLGRLGADFAQGFHYGRPLGLLDLIRWLESSAYGMPSCAATQAAHAAAFLALAEDAARDGGGARQAEWMRRLEDEHVNIRIALDWALRHGEPLTAVRLATALRFFWVDRGHVAAGTQILSDALARPETGRRDAVRAAGLNALGMLLGQAGDLDRARAALEESVSIHRDLGDEAALARALNNLGIVAALGGDNAAARARYHESFELRRGLRDARGQSATLNNLAVVAYREGDLAAAERWGRTALATRERRDTRTTAEVLDTLGAVALARGDLAAAARNYQESFACYSAIGASGDDAQPLIGLAQVAFRRGDPLVAAALAGAVSRVRERFGGKPALDQAGFDGMLARLRATLAADDLDAAIGRGREMNAAEVLALARSLRGPALAAAAEARGVLRPHAAVAPVPVASAQG